MNELLLEEEKEGSKLAIRFRYVIALAILASALANISNIDSLAGHLINITAIIGYLINTWIHSLFLKQKQSRWTLKYDYVSIFVDNALVTWTITNWFLLEGKQNPNFLIKNPVSLFYLLPLALSLFQYRFGMVFFSFTCFLLSYFGFFVYAILHDAKFGLNWNLYVLGDEVIFADALVSKPAAYFVLTLAIFYAIYRSLLLMQKFAMAESHKNTLSRYFSPNIVSEIVASEEVYTVGKRQKVTVLFSDIRNFTQFSEKMEPELLSEFLTEFRKRMVRAIFQFEGSLDKFIGDAVMATFGTPIPSPIPGENSKQAIKAAYAMLNELDELNLERKAEGKSPIQIGIGIHTGEVFCGSIGSEDRMEYTVIGDTVNTASRIESACKQFHSALVISDLVFQEIGLPDGWEEQKNVMLPGKESAIRLWVSTKARYDAVFNL